MENLAATKNTTQRIDTALTLIRELTGELERHLTAVREQRERHPNGEPHSITEKNLSQLSDQFQLIREHGERLDYNTFTNVTDNVEELIKKLRLPVQFRRADILTDLIEILEGLEAVVETKLKNGDSRAERKK